jgi:hypothetical protein
VGGGFQREAFHVLKALEELKQTSTELTGFGSQSFVFPDLTVRTVSISAIQNVVEEFIHDFAFPLPFLFRLGFWFSD